MKETKDEKVTKVAKKIEKTEEKLPLKEEGKKKSTKKETVKKQTATTKKASSTAKKSTSSAKKTAETKATTATKKASSTAKKSTSSAKKTAETKATTATKKASSTAKKTTSSTRKTTKTNTVSATTINTVNEYYDLPYRYNQTTVKILAQTPHSLFVYWDVSDDDRNEMTRKYGEDFFYQTKPILVVHNKTLDTTYEVEIDDFTNSWYLKTPTSDCIFDIELARKRINNIKPSPFENGSNILYIANSNTIESPNDHFMGDSLSTVYFKNIKNNSIEERNYSKYSETKNIYDFMKIYDNEFGCKNNPSSNFRIN